LRRAPAGWKHDPHLPGGRAYVWQDPPTGGRHLWVAYPGPRGSWLIKDRSAGSDGQVQCWDSLESFETHVRSTPNP